MPRLKWLPSELEVLEQDYVTGVPIAHIAEKLGRTANSITCKASNMGLAFNSVRKFTVAPTASPNRTTEEVVRDQVDRFKRKRERGDQKRDGIDIHLKEDAPFALVAFGDPHVDDDGTDLGHFMWACELVSNADGAYAFNIGDLTNNWVGRLERLYGYQGTTNDEAREMLDWVIGLTDWMFVLLGNHDKWYAYAEMAAKHAGVKTVSHGAIFNIHCGDAVVKIDARHDHPGRSQYISNFAQNKANWRGSPAHIIVAGHIHQGSSSVVRNGYSGTLAQCIRLGAFKRYDEYADQLGFVDSSVGPVACMVVDPSKPDDDPGFIQVFWDLESGLDMLALKRGRAKERGGK